jgi:hypothetical protein
VAVAAVTVTTAHLQDNKTELLVVLVAVAVVKTVLLAPVVREIHLPLHLAKALLVAQVV